ncbi:MAG: hypothetical protein AAGE59_02865 [Cyanobacteria bacterium P01_F01_bin.86]
MLNRVHWAVALPTMLLWALPGLAGEETGISRSYYPVVPSSDVGTLICYAETNNGELLNLNRLCHPDFVASDDPAFVDVSDRSSEVLGDRPTGQDKACYFVDSNGRPCS